MLYEAFPGTSCMTTIRTSTTTTTTSDTNDTKFSTTSTSRFTTLSTSSSTTTTTTTTRDTNQYIALSPYASCDITECINEDDPLGVYYRIDFLFRFFFNRRKLISQEGSIEKDFGPVEMIRLFSVKIKNSNKKR